MTDDRVMREHEALIYELYGKECERKMKDQNEVVFMGRIEQCKEIANTIRYCGTPLASAAVLYRKGYRHTPTLLSSILDEAKKKSRMIYEQNGEWHDNIRIEDLYEILQSFEVKTDEH